MLLTVEPSFEKDVIIVTRSDNKGKEIVEITREYLLENATDELVEKLSVFIKSPTEETAMYLHQHLFPNKVIEEDF